MITETVVLIWTVRLGNRPSKDSHRFLRLEVQFPRLYKTDTDRKISFWARQNQPTPSPRSSCSTSSSESVRWRDADTLTIRQTGVRYAWAVPYYGRRVSLSWWATTTMSFKVPPTTTYTLWSPRGNGWISQQECPRRLCWLDYVLLRRNICMRNANRIRNENLFWWEPMVYKYLSPFLQLIRFVEWKGQGDVGTHSQDLGAEHEGLISIFLLICVPGLSVSGHSAAKVLKSRAQCNSYFHFYRLSVTKVLQPGSGEVESKNTGSITNPHIWFQHCRSGNL